jgi:hemolysin D
MSTAISIRLQAFGDLLGRYAAVFRHAWRERKTLDARPRQPHEAEFLPAALELLETPLSPAPRIAAALLVGFALIAVLWAVFGQIDMVATARGKIIPGNGSKVIQPFETATVKSIRVTDGQAVKAGEVLIELDATTATADQARIGNDLAAARLQAARARAMLAAIDSGQRPVLPTLADIPAERQAQEQRLLAGQVDEYRTKLSRIDADIVRREAELASTRQIVAKLEQTVPIARRRAQDFKGLVDKKFISEHGYLDKEQARIEQEADLATQKSRLNELAAAVQEGRNQRLALAAESRRIALDSLTEGEQKSATLTQDRLKADARGKLMTLTAPVDGTVQQLAVHTVGGVVTEAQALMIVVPREDALEVEAFLDNKDIGFVTAGQIAAVKIETFPYTKYGTVSAKVAHVSDDAINDEKKGLIYASRLKLDHTAIRVEGKMVNLAPGMAVTAEIKTGNRRVIEYFLSPLLQYKDESLRER